MQCVSELHIEYQYSLQTRALFENGITPIDCVGDIFQHRWRLLAKQQLPVPVWNSASFPTKNADWSARSLTSWRQLEFVLSSWIIIAQAAFQELKFTDETQLWELNQDQTTQS